MVFVSGGRGSCVEIIAQGLCARFVCVPLRRVLEYWRSVLIIVNAEQK